jgi:hypothetical protein
MKRQVFFAIAGIVSAVFGLSFLLATEMSLRMYGVPTDPHNVMQGRYFGSALLALGLLWFLARDTQDPAAIRAILVAALVGNVAGGAISVASVGTLQNGMAWTSVGIYAAFALASAYFLLAGRRAATPVAT